MRRKPPPVLPAGALAAYHPALGHRTDIVRRSQQAVDRLFLFQEVPLT
jgi:hypothetical protein